MTTITAGLVGVDDPPLVQVIVSGVPAGSKLDVWRDDSLGSTLVRGEQGTVPLAGIRIMLDGEAPMGRVLSYRAEETTAAGVVTSTVSNLIVYADPGRHAFTNPYSGESVLVDMPSADDRRNTDLQGSVLRIVGRRSPIPLSDVRGGEAGTLTVITRTAEETRRLGDLLAAGHPLVSRHRPISDHPPVEFLTFLTVDKARRWPEADNYAGGRILEMQYVVVDPPDPRLGIVMATLQDIAGAYNGLTLTDLSGDFATLLDLAAADFR